MFILKLNELHTHTCAAPVSLPKAALRGELSACEISCTRHQLGDLLTSLIPHVDAHVAAMRADGIPEAYCAAHMLINHNIKNACPWRRGRVVRFMGRADFPNWWGQLPLHAYTVSNVHNRTLVPFVALPLRTRPIRAYAATGAPFSVNHVLDAFNESRLSDRLGIDQFLRTVLHDDNAPQLFRQLGVVRSIIGKAPITPAVACAEHKLIAADAYVAAVCDKTLILGGKPAKALRQAVSLLRNDKGEGLWDELKI